MPNKPIPYSIRRRIWDLRKSDCLSLDKIQERIGQEHAYNPELPPAPARRTIAKYLKMFDAIPFDRNLDRPFELNELDTYGLPWEAGEYVLGMWRNTHSPWSGFINVVTGMPLPKPTARQVRWWWRIHRAVPVFGETDVWFLSELFVVREFVKDVLEEDVAFDDLEAFLAFGPWESEEALDKYNSAIANKHISAIDRQQLLDEVGKIPKDVLTGQKSGMDAVALLRSMAASVQIPEQIPSDIAG